MQKNGAGLQTASTCFWDNSTDGKTPLFSSYMQLLNDLEGAVGVVSLKSKIFSCEFEK